ncbi:type II toxin-antitoxin system VapC family toxin [Candidatus Parabeggiatoa sp. HSG14]|uniref:type II toxin-antitoxin system VapC family toxin n=1 Tax=Candidatus Parabeggiatoa sp. HSG14 TaxID=3055593 RepID=UPI0025A7B731|nr:type II toxin-antitoxin system VapC family toxin [Thiotrichales bacterium HSG14]
MVIDSSAVIAILYNEADAEYFVTAIEGDSNRLMSAASLLETSIVIESRYGEEGGRKLDLLLSKAQVKIEPVTFEQAETARAAFRTFGKGRHPAALNFGDCFSYALAKVLGEPLLFKGNDFSKTDIKQA